MNSQYSETFQYTFIRRRIVKITGNKIRIGIKTEGEVSILRGELRQDKEATRFPDTDVPETEGISDSGIRQKKQRIAG